MASSRVVRVRRGDNSVAAQELIHGITQIQAELKVTPEFPEPVEAAARKAAADPRLPGRDRTDMAFVTIDPPGAMDLDQALFIERDGDGFVVHYAIADLAAFISPGDPVDQEAHQRGETLYGADSKVPLHPTELSEGAASLLPDEVRPAFVWSIKVDETGEGNDVVVERALVKSRARLDYEEVQKQIDGGTAEESLMLLREVGKLRIEREAARGGVSLPLPEQEVDIEGDHWRLSFRSLLPVEQWNAQISLLTGFAAASLMVYARVGLLRTLPPADPRDIQRLHRTARALKIDWPAEQLYPDFIRSLDPGQPAHAAMIVACTRLLRGAAYVSFNGEVPEQPQHAALASEYAHVTAPLRRLGDRYALEVCAALCAGEEVPDWVLTGLKDLPEILQQSGRKSRQYENAVLDLVEAGVLHGREGDSFDAVVVDLDDRDESRGTVTVQEPAVEAEVATAGGKLPLGEDVEVTLRTADVRSRTVEFALSER
jgi:exoribonuclease R